MEKKESGVRSARRGREKSRLLTSGLGVISSGGKQAKTAQRSLEGNDKSWLWGQLDDEAEREKGNPDSYYPYGKS